MLKRFFLVVIGFISLGKTGLAQQDAMFSQYMFNMLSVNPAYAGSRDVISTTALYRHQWAGLEGSPRTMTFTADAPFNKEKVGLGINVFKDQAGVMGNTGLNANYAYRLKLPKGVMAMGLSAGFTAYKVDLTSVSTSSTGAYDQAFSSNVQRTKPNFGTGVYYHSSKYYVGLSAPHLFRHTLKGTNDSAIIYRKNHLFAIAGYVFTINSHLKAKPSILIKYVNGAPLQADLNMNVWIFDRAAVGMSYRTGDAILVMFEVQANKQFRCGLAYDYALTRLRRYTAGSFELMARYEFGGYTKAKVVTPRYF